MRKGKVPVLSIASGIDFGDPMRIKLPPLSLIEELLISQSRLYVSIVKLIGDQESERQSAKRGHVITFPQPDGPTKLAELQRMNSSNSECYPRVENLSEFISVVFIGSRLQFDALIPSRFKNIKELRVRTEVIYLWLYALKNLNPLYQNITIVETTGIRSALERLTMDLIDNATIVDNEADILVDQIATPEGATDVPIEEIHEEFNDLDAPMDLPSSLLTRSIPISRDISAPARSIFQGVLHTFLDQNDDSKAQDDRNDLTSEDDDSDGKLYVASFKI